MPNETKTAATTTAKASKIHDPMLTLQRAVAYIVLFVLCFICLFFFYVLIVNATHNNFTIQQGFDPLPRGSFGVNFFNTTHDANVPIPDRSAQQPDRVGCLCGAVGLFQRTDGLRYLCV